MFLDGIGVAGILVLLGIVLFFFLGVIGASIFIVIVLVRRHKRKALLESQSERDDLKGLE